MNALCEPIALDTPVGIDLKYDDSYVVIETEVDKLNTLSGLNDVDWVAVCESAASLLAEKTKDVKLSVWWAFGRYKRDQLDGLVEGLETINGLLCEYGERLFPVSSRAKLSALEWFENNINASLIRSDAPEIPAHQVELLHEQLKRYRENVQTVCGVSDSFFRELIERLEKAVAANVPVEQENAKSREPVQKNVEEGEIADEADAQKVLSQLKKNAEKLSRYWRQKTVYDIRALRLTRMVSWLEIDGTPPAQNGKTMLNAPSIQRIEEIEAHIAQNRIEEAIELTETTLLRAPFWFAGQQMVYEMLVSKGHETEASYVKSSVSAMLNTFEGMAEANFKDATPFVPTDMKTWLQTDPGLQVQGEFIDPYSAVREECHELIKRKELKSAMETLQRHCATSISKEEEFRWRLLQCEIALEASKIPMALAILGELEQFIEAFNLDIWRPDLSSRVYLFLLQSFTRGQLDKARYDRAYERLCHVDPAAATEVKIH